MATPIEVGDRFGRLVVLGRGEPYFTPNGRKQGRWLCRCECGAERNVMGSALRTGKQYSCGCSRRSGTNDLMREAGVMRRQDRLTYYGVHARLARDRGRARDRLCVDCAAPATSWSYDGTDPAELYFDPPHGKRRLAYSMDPDRYQPRCHSCHLRLDGITPPWFTPQAR